MKKTIALLIILLFAAEHPAWAKRRTKKAKTDRATLREWRRRKRKMTPIQFKDLVEALHRSELEVKKLEKRNKELEKHCEQLKEVSHSHKEPREATEALEEETATPEHTQQDNELSTEGTQVQHRVGKKSDQPTIEGADMSAGSGDITCAVQVVSRKGEPFKTYQEAEEVKKKLRKDGYNTWIVVYRDGRRVPLKQVLSHILKHASTPAE
mgnify:CR=1 FL=1